MKMWVTFHYFVQNTLVFDKHKKDFTLNMLTLQSPRKYCYFEGFKSVSSEIMNGDPQLLFHIFKVTYLKIIY